MQAVLRGKRLRKEMEAGMGAVSTRSVGGDASIRTRATEARLKLTQSLAIRLYTVPEKINMYLLLKMRSSWKLDFRDVVISDMISGMALTVNITKPSLAPCRNSGVPKKYTFELRVANQSTVHNATKQKGRIDNGENSVSPLKHARVLDMTYRNKSSDTYYTQLFELGLSERAPSSSSSSPSLNELILRRVQQSQVLTNNHTYIVAKGAIEFMSFNYLYRVVNTVSESVIKLTKANNNQTFIFKFAREYFDQSFNVRAMIRSLFKFLFAYSRFEKLLHEDHDIALMTLPFPNTLTTTDEPPSTPGPCPTNVDHRSSPFQRDENGDEITTVSYKQKTFMQLLDESSPSPSKFDASINDVDVSVDQAVVSSGITFTLVSKTEGAPIFSHSLEIHDGSDRKPLPPKIDYVVKLQEEDPKEAVKNQQSHQHASHSPEADKQKP